MSWMSSFTLRRQTPVTGRRGDWVLALILVFLQLLAPRTGSADTTTPSMSAEVAAVILAVGQGLPLVWRRKHPGAVAGCVIVCYAGSLAVLGLVPPFAAWVVIWSLASQPGDRRRSSLAMLTAGSTIALVILAELSRSGSGAWAPYLFVTTVVTLGAILLRSERGRLLAVRERGATQERLRIASDLHDLVGHGLSALAIQSSTARMALDAGDTQSASAALSAIEATSRTTMREMRQMLGVLRGVDGDDVTRPAPGVSDIETLLENVRAGGTVVAAEFDTDLDDIAPDTQLCAYRVVQEALTNAVKHARGALVTVRIAREVQELEVRVVTTGADEVNSTAPDAGGVGLDGLRARVAAAGGHLHAGPTADGWVVEARLPAKYVETL